MVAGVKPGVLPLLSYETRDSMLLIGWLSKE